MLELAVRFQTEDERPLPCEGCSAPRTHHVPVCGEHDPYLISFWVSLCERCLVDERRGQLAVRRVRARGWARPGFVLTEDEEPPHELSSRMRALEAAGR